MKTKDDKKTLELALVKPGRPPVDGVTKTHAERQKAYRQRKAAEGLLTVTFILPADVRAALDRHVRFKELTKSAAIEKIVRDRLMRSR